MKKCDYCNKELDSYHIQYCRDTDCEKKALRFYEVRREKENIFGVINIITIIAIMGGLIMAMFSPVVGNIIVASSLAILSTTVMIFPFAPESFYKKYKIKKTSTIVRGFGIAFYAAAMIFAAVAVYYSK